MITDKDMENALNELKEAQDYFNECVGYLIDYAIARMKCAETLIDCLVKQRASEVKK